MTDHRTSADLSSALGSGFRTAVSASSEGRRHWTRTGGLGQWPTPDQRPHVPATATARMRGRLHARRERRLLPQDRLGTVLAQFDPRPSPKWRRGLARAPARPAPARPAPHSRERPSRGDSDLLDDPHRRDGRVLELLRRRVPHQRPVAESLAGEIAGGLLATLCSGHCQP